MREEILDALAAWVNNAATTIINNAFAAMMAAAQISSPSRRAGKIADQIGDGLIIRMTAKGKELAEVCKRITDKVFDTLQIDPSKLITNAQDVLHSMKSALPALESNIRHTTHRQPAPSYGQPVQLIVDMTRGQYYVREDADIDKIAGAVEKRLSGKVAYHNRVGGIALQS